MEYGDWFERIAGFRPHPWQLALGTDEACQDHLLRIPTGFGKTAGTALAWLYHRVLRGDERWPARLVFCLPMRVLVEQTESAIAAWVRAAGVDVPVTVLLGGRHESTWLERPELPTIVVGTQDMLLSRALGRGYGSARGLWPMEMGLLHSDALWVVDEVQLMDVGLATTTQLHAFRGGDASNGRTRLRPVFTWWMSATLQPRWLDTVDFASRRGVVPETRIEVALRTGGLWDVQKALDVRPAAGAPEEVAQLTVDAHLEGELSLVIVNTVERARKVHEAIAKKKLAADVVLVHSRFRGHERSSWDFLRRDAPRPPAGRIVVATQVVEAGVDISAASLVTDLAPWSSLVQRFGRCARYSNERGSVVVAGAPSDEKKAAPYSLTELEAASRALARIGADVGPRSLEDFEERLTREDPALLEQLYPYVPLHVLRRPDFDELFDTTPDLSGADLDVSRYIRSGEERDVSVFWREVPEPAPRDLAEVEPPSREELCPVPIHEIRDFIGKKRVAFVRDYMTGVWRRVDRFVPGMTVLLAASAGGYDARRGWDPKSSAPVVPAASALHATAFELTAAAADDEELSAYPWKSIGTHGRETGAEAARLAGALTVPTELGRLLELAGRWHDAGKAHPTFQGAIREASRAAAGQLGRHDLAKAPREAWRRPPYPERPGFRHELASTLMILELARRSVPDHAGLLGPHVALLEGVGQPPEWPAAADRVTGSALADELVRMSADELDLVLYLVCSHHGKVRTGWASTPNDQQAAHGGIHGVCEGDEVPSLSLSVGGAREALPSLRLSLASSAIGLSARYGASWGERVSGLLERFGPFTLAYLEAIFRIADWRASQLDTPEDS